MCGFVAIINSSDQSRSRDLIPKMNDLINHRGPDDEGYFFDDKIGLGFKRLSIHDLSKSGHQPMHSNDKKYTIVFNGEVYNFIELRENLVKKGYQFSSGTDTEVVLNCFIEYGQDCVLKFLGMFAFIIYEHETKKVFVARDHLGIKPLYYLNKDGEMFFASEIKAFSPIVNFSLNNDSLAEQMYFRYVSGINTPFKDIFKVPAGSFYYGHISEDIDFIKYYRIDDSLNGKCKLLNHNEIKGKLSESINIHTRSDVGFNVQLSGGVDSSYITAILGKTEKLSTYSIAFKNQKFDESDCQKWVADTYKTDHHEVQMGSEEFADELENATYHMDVPIVHLGCVFLKRLCRESRKSSKVILTGEGADELFAGYSRHNLSSKEKLAYSFKKYGTPSWMLPPIGPLNTLKSMVNTSTIFNQLNFSKSELDNIFIDLKMNFNEREKVVSRHKDPYNSILAHDQTAYLESLLDRQDKMSMGESVESRVPFCNPKLFDLVNPISFDEKVKNGVTKSILKKIGEQVLNDDILYKRKMGLTIPVDDWFRDGPLNEMSSMLTDTTFKSRGFYNHKKISEIIDCHMSHKGNYGKYLAHLLMFEIWHRKFIG